SIVASGMSRVGEAERRPPAPAEDWIRGNAVRSAAAAATQPDSSRRGSATPPPLPDSREYRGGAHDLQQRLTEALQYAPQAAAAFGVAQGAARSAGADTSRQRSGEPWHGPGNVT